MKKFQIIISNTSRSLSYLKNLAHYRIYPSKIIYLDDKKNITYKKELIRNKFYLPRVFVKKFISRDINQNIANYILQQSESIFIYSGYPGLIIRNNELLNKKKLIHNHPGKLPYYKGSTTIYYSLLKSNKIHCTTLILNQHIDGGKVLLEKLHKKPRNITDLEKKFDDKIRSSNLIYTLKNLDQLKPKKQKKCNSSPYYIAHPLLRSLVFNKQI